jgi:hypothetical protein
MMVRCKLAPFLGWVSRIFTNVEETKERRQDKLKHQCNTEKGRGPKGFPSG